MSSHTKTSDSVGLLYLYVLEWENLPADSRTVAVGCDAAYGHPGVRCGFHELVDFLWADNPDAPGEVKPAPPTAVNIPEPTRLENSNAVSLRGKLLAYERGALCKFMNPERAVKGSGIDYYAAIENTGDSFVRVKNAIANGGAVSTLNTKLLNLCKTAFAVTRELRRMDADRVLIASMKTFLRDIPDRNGNPLGGKPDTKLQTSSVPGVTAWSKFDVYRTYGLYGALVQNFDNKVETELTRLHNTALGIVHARALHSADIAFYAVQCILP